MKTLKILTILLLLSTLFTSCQQDDSAEPSEENGPLSGELKFTVRLINVRKDAPNWLKIYIKGTSDMEKECSVDCPSYFNCYDCNWDVVSGNCGGITSLCEFQSCSSCIVEQDFSFGTLGKPNGKLMPGTYVIRIVGIQDIFNEGRTNIFVSARG
jgi:hypothetical protein